MTELKWDASKSIGFDSIDLQHQKLFSIFNDLCRAMQTSREWPVVKQAVDDLLQYAGQHFSDEERIMREYGYPDADRQMLEHREFLAKAKQFHFDKMMNDPGLAQEIFLFLAGWIIEHTSTLDVMLGKYIQKMNAAK